MGLLDGDLLKMHKRQQQSARLSALAQGLLSAGQRGAGLLSGLAQGTTGAAQAGQGSLGQLAQLAQLQLQIDADRDRKDRGDRFSKAVGGEGPLGAGLTDQQRAVLPLLGPEAGMRLLGKRAFGTPDKGVNLSPGAILVSPAGKTIASNPARPRRQSAMDAKIAEIMATMGTDRKTAAGIATGATKLAFDPVTNQPFVVDLATGTSRALSPAGQTQAPKAPKPAKAPQGGTLFNLAEETAGVVSGAKSFLSGIGGQISDDLVATKTVEARQSILAAQNGLIRALSINPRFPVGEINRLREEIAIAPNIFDSAESLRSRMRAIDSALRERLPNEIAAAQDINLPVKTRQNAATAAKDIENFLKLLGVPQDSDAPPPPPGFEVIN